MTHDLDQLWLTVLTALQEKVSKGIFLTLLKPTRLMTLEGGVATVSAPSTMVVDMLEKRFRSDLSTLLTEQTGAPVAVVFVIKSMIAQTTPGKPAPLFQETEAPAALSLGHLPRVRPDYTFTNFAVSSSNQLAFTAAQTVAATLGTAYNPLFLYGPVGVGKTHLMHAIANDVYQKAPDRKIIYITSEEFTNEVIEAIRDHDTSRMKRRFRSAVLLLIDDIQFIEGKEKVQEELFHTFNILIDNGAQIALSSDRPPQEIKKLEKRLSSRFAGGLTVDIQEPDLELKTAILQKKAEKFGKSISVEVALQIAEGARDTRSLEGLLLRVITQASFTGSEITPELARQALGGVIEEKSNRLHSDDVIDAVCDFYHVKQTQLKGPKRDASLVRARQVAMYLLKSELHLTLVEIGNLLGGRDHTTIMHGVEKVEGLVENQAQVSADIKGITKSLRS
jgi:chromosomal replication initiator protein